MFHPVVSSETNVVRAASRRSTRVPAAPTLEEAFDARLLHEVACWDDQAAFESLYETHVAAVTRAALSICGDAGIAEDIVQQAFTALWIRAGRIAARSLRIGPWLCTVARNSALEYVRKESRLPVDAVAAEPDAPGPEQFVLEAQTTAELHDALARLPFEQRRVLRMVYFGGMSCPAAAEAIGCPVQSIRSLVRYALRELRAQLAPK